MTTTRQSSADRRQSLLEAALHLFSTQGYDGTTTKAIAERSGVTEALLFRHFRSKPDLLREVVQAFGPRRLFAPPDVAWHALPAYDALERLVTRYLDAFWEHRAFMRMVFTTPKKDQDVYAHLWAEFGKQGFYLYAALQERADRGELRADIAASGTDIIAAAVAGFLQRVLTDEPEDWDAARAQFVTNLLQILFGGIAASGEKT